MITTNKNCNKYVAEMKPFKTLELAGIHLGRLYIIYKNGFNPILIYDSGQNAWFESQEKERSPEKKLQALIRPQEPMNQVSKTIIKNMIEEEKQRISTSEV